MQPLDALALGLGPDGACSLGLGLGRGLGLGLGLGRGDDGLHLSGVCGGEGVELAGSIGANLRNLGALALHLSLYPGGSPVSIGHLGGLGASLCVAAAVASRSAWPWRTCSAASAAAFSTRSAASAWAASTSARAPATAFSTRSMAACSAAAMCSAARVARR